MGSGPSSNQKALKRAIKGNDVKTVFELLRSGVNVDGPIDTVWEHTPLILATCYGAHGVIPLLLRVCRRKDACNYEGHTALDKGIIYYSLACQFFQHKPSEIQRRLAILKTLTEGGCKRVKVPDIELWIKENRHDAEFMINMVQLFCCSKSFYFKSIGLATMTRLNAEPNYLRQILESGAGFNYYLKTCNLRDDFVFDCPAYISDSVAELLIQASSISSIHTHVINMKLRESRRSRKGPTLPERLRDLLLEAEYPLDATLRPQQEKRIQPKCLTHLCRNVIRDLLKPNVLFGAKHLPLPPKLQAFVTLDAS